MAISLLSTPRTNHCLLSQFPLSSATAGGQLALSFRFPPTPPKLIMVTLCSSSTSTPVEEDGLPRPSDAISAQPESSVNDGEKRSVPIGGCKVCGREEIERGCNGEGSIQGGIATVPGFGWWPIKVYRPCPGFVASGGRYRRRGQSMDEVAFGRAGPSSTPVDIDRAVKLSKKQKDTRKFKS